jgi:hypothetical protein
MKAPAVGRGAERVDREAWAGNVDHTFSRVPRNNATSPLRDRLILFAVATCIKHGIWCRPLSHALDRIVEHRERQR